MKVFGGGRSSGEGAGVRGRLRSAAIRFRSTARILSSTKVTSAILAVLIGGAVSLPYLRSFVMVRFDLDVEWAIPVQIYYAGEAEVPFQEGLSVTRWAGPGKSVVKIRLPVHTLRALRIDFGQNPGRFFVGPVHVEGATEQTLDWKRFAPSPDVENQNADDSGTLRASSKRIDPFFVYDGRLDIRARFPFDGLARLVFIAVLVFFLAEFDVRFSGGHGVCQGAGCLSRIVRDLARRTLLPFSAVLKDKRFLVYMAVVLAAGWGFELANFTTTFDDETVLFHPPRELWIGQGRWVLYLLDGLLCNVSAPFVALGVTLSLYALSFCLVFWRAGRDKYVLFPIYAAFPMLFQSFSFSSLNPGIGLGFLTAAMSARMVFERGTPTILAGMAFGCLALGTYQVFLVYMAIAILYLLLSRVVRRSFFLRGDLLARSFGRALIVVVGSIALYQTIQFRFVSDMGGMADGFVRQVYVQPIGSMEEFSRWIGLMAGKVTAILSGHPVFFPFRLRAFCAMSVVAPLAAAWCILLGWRRGPFSKGAVLFGLAILAALPFAPDSLNRFAGIPCRVITVLLPASLVAFLSIALRMAQEAGRFRLVICILCAAAGLQFLWSLNLETYSNVLQNRWDANFANDLNARIEVLPEVARLEAEEREIPLTVVGSCRFDRSFLPPNSRNGWPQWEFESIGRSTFAVPKRFADTLRLHTGERFRFVPIEDLSDEVRSFADGMPVWPQNGSIAWFDGLVVIKFEENRR